MCTATPTTCKTTGYQALNAASIWCSLPALLLTELPEHTGAELAQCQEYAVSMCKVREDRQTFWQPRQRDGQSLLPRRTATPPLPLPAPPAPTALQTPWQLRVPDLPRGADGGGGGVHCMACNLFAILARGCTATPVELSLLLMGNAPEGP